MHLARLAPDTMRGDEDSVRRARAGDAGAWAELVRVYQEPLLRLATAILRNLEDARDTCQEAFRTAFQKLGGLQSAERLDLWLRRILINEARDLLRKRKVREARAAEPEALPEPPRPEHLLTGKEDRERIVAALDRMPLEWREVLVAHLLEDRSYVELAEMLDLSVNAVRIRVHRALARLRELLAEKTR